MPRQTHTQMTRQKLDAPEFHSGGKKIYFNLSSQNNPQISDSVTTEVTDIFPTYFHYVLVMWRDSGIV